MKVTSSLKSISLNEESPKGEELEELAFGILQLIVKDPVQPENTEPPMVVTLWGIVIEVKPMQPENAEPPMVVTHWGIVIEVKPLQL